MEKKEFSYKKSGVDISRTDKLKEEMVNILDTKNERVLNKVGAFASLYDFKKFEDIENPVLVLKAEEPGSKQKLAIEHEKVRSVCFDMINHLVNDIAVMGAQPLAVLDTIVTGSIDEDVTKELVKGISDACSENECNLVGGETSIQPGILATDTFVLTSSIVGVVDKDHVIDGSDVSEGNVILSIASNGLHTNGYTLIRKMMDTIDGLKEKKLSSGESFLEAIMQPHTPYYKLISKVRNAGVSIKAMAHITGGGIEGNLCRVIPDGFTAEIDLSTINILELFKIIKEYGNIEDDEMLSTFNCGVGLIMVVDKNDLDKITSISNLLEYDVYPIGSIKKDSDVKIHFINKLKW